MSPLSLYGRVKGMTRLGFLMIAVLSLVTVNAPARAQEQASVRAGTHEGYQRLVFEWGGAPDYAVVRDGDVVTLTFKKSASLDMAVAKSLSNIRDAKSATSSDNTVVTLTLPAGSKIRDVKIGNKIMLDVYDPPAVKKPVEKPASVKEAPKQEAPPAAEAKPAPAAEEKKALPEETKQSAPPVPVTAPAPVETKPAEAKPAETPVPKIVPPAAAIEPHVMSVSATKNTGLAVFRRGNWLWIVADDSGLTLAPAISGPQKEKFGTVQRFAAKGGSAFRLKMPDGVGVTAEGGGMNWRLVFSPNPKKVESIVPERLSPVAASEQTKAPRQGSALRWGFSTGKPRQIIDLTDPDIGDVIKVVTMTDSAEAARDSQGFVELQTLPAYIGFAFLPLADDVNVTIGDAGVRVGRGEKDLSLSMTGQGLTSKTKTDVSLASPDKEVPINKNNFFHLSRWEMGGLRALNENQSVIMSGIGAKSDKSKIEDLLTLAKLTLANDRGAESLGYLRAAEQIKPDIIEDKEFIGLRGGAALLAGQPDLAIADLLNPALDVYHDVPFWRTAAFATLEDWQQAIKMLPKNIRAIDTYPKEVREYLSLAMSEVALRSGRLTEAEVMLGDLEPAAGDMSLNHQADWTYLMGEAARQLKQYEKAKEYWKKLDKSKDDYYRAKANLALTRLLLERNEIKPAQAIDRLEGLRYAWRGDELEALTNYRLGRVYIENNDYLKGFYVLRSAATLSPESHLGREVADYMTKTFRDLYDSDKLQNVPPLDVIGVYEEFKELSPTGAEGDRIVEQLAERMIDVDLLPRAVSLLDYQLAHRLQGAEAGRVAMRLATIRLLDNKPEGALKDLARAEEFYKASPEKVVPPDKQREITLLRSNALSKTNKADQALLLLETLPADKTVARLRADIAWKSQRWAEAADSLQTLLGVEQITAGRPLTADQTDLILNRAIALNLSGDRVGLATVREKYGALMKQTPKSELFDVVTLPRRFGLIRSRDTIAESINNVDLFKDFLESYRKASVPAPVKEEPKTAEVKPAEATAETKPAEEEAQEVTPSPQAVPPAETPAAAKTPAPATTEAAPTAAPAPAENTSAPADSTAPAPATDTAAPAQTPVPAPAEQ